MNIKLTKLFGRYSTLNHINNFKKNNPDINIEINSGVAKQVLFELDFKT